MASSSSRTSSGPELRTRLLRPQEYWGWPNGIAVRTQISKQADIPVLLWLHRHEYDDHVVEANYRPHEPRCAHETDYEPHPFGFAAVVWATLTRRWSTSVRRPRSIC